MNKKFARILTLVLALVMCAAMAVPALAATGEFTYPPITGETINFTFDKYLVLDSSANVPDVTFEFEIAPFSGTAEGILPGPVGANGTTAPTVGTASFTYTADNATRSTETTGKTVELGSGQGYVTKTVAVDFSGVSFSEPGVYRYELKEKTGTVPGVSYDTNTYYIDILVEDDGTGLVINQRILHKSGTVAAVEAENKISGIQNSYATHDLTVSKTVSGNKGSRDKYFQFTVTVNGAAPGTYSVVYDPPGAPQQNAATDDSYSLTNPTTIAVTGSTGTLTCYLQHNQTVTIKGLPEHATWTAVEVEEDYTPSVTVSGDEDATASGNTASSSNGGLTANTTVAFANRREGSINTGVLLTVAPFVVLMLIGLAGATVVLKKKHN